MLLEQTGEYSGQARCEIVAALKSMLPKGCVIDDRTTMKAFDSDALSAYRNLPLVVVLPEAARQVSDVMKWCRDNKVKIVPPGQEPAWRGVPLSRPGIMSLGKIQSEITEIDYQNRTVTASRRSQSAYTAVQDVILVFIVLTL